MVYPGVVNLGYRPTVSSGKSERILEIHLLDFYCEIYGKDLEVRFVRYLRPEKKFEKCRRPCSANRVRCSPGTRTSGTIEELERAVGDGN